MLCRQRCRGSKFDIGSVAMIALLLSSGARVAAADGKSNEVSAVSERSGALRGTKESPTAIRAPGAIRLEPVSEPGTSGTNRVPVKRFFVNGTIERVSTGEKVADCVLEVRTTNGVMRIRVPARASVQRAGRAVGADSLTAGEGVGIVARKAADGHLEALTLRLGVRGPTTGPDKARDKDDGNLPTR